MPIGSGSSIDTSIPERAKEERKELLQLSDLIEELAERGGGLPSRDATVAILQLAQKVIDEQNIEIQHLRKQLFGRRSEKVSPNQLSFFAEMLQTLVEEEPEPEEKKRKKKKKKIKRRPLEPTRTEEIKVPDEERPCPVCGKERCPMHPVRSLVVEYQPAKIEVIEYLREQLVCRPCEGEITVAPQPEERVIDRALPGPKMLASLVVNKTVDGLPLRRSQRIFKRAGLDIPIATLSRWEGFAHQLLGPVIQLAKKKVLEADTINTDDTGIRVRDPEIARGTWSGHIWTFLGRKYDPGGDLTKTVEYVYYMYAPTWEASYPEAFLDGCSAVIQGDAYRGYERIASPIRGDHVGKLLAGCCMHARRPFVQALESNDPTAAFFVGRFQQIYRIEARAKEDRLTADERLDLRQTEGVPIMEEIYERSRELSSLPLLKPMKNGVRYFVNQWEKLMVPFTKDGRLEIDNGSAERLLRRVATGRKAWMFAGSHNGANRFADVLSLVSTADAAGIDAGDYLPSIISHVSSWPNSRIDELLPHRWLEALQRFLEEMPQEGSTA